ncbi:hypothetical protein [Hyphomicrobium sp. LHD-15]|uniref:hypothetical protein n=1 Tax=Hyphomicrobium sp. LHD-15 TaxID=3072142 RepID=UPI00280EE823|nr:hypothetical protein [Hyphomicrobium sp. LHD-15]MDQ8698041.1 hypothetical protein [Hyphomicrobium sp. LHD-15]
MVQYGLFWFDGAAIASLKASAHYGGFGMVSSSSEDWEVVTARAFSRLATGRHEDAADLLLRMEAELATEASPPLRAAIHNNAGLAHLLRDRSQDAGSAFETAASLWKQTLLSVRETEIPISGRSSSFHLMLAARHHSAFAELRRRRVIELLGTATQMTELNRSPLWRERGAQASEFLSKVCEAFGPNCAEAVIARDQLARGGQEGAVDPSPYRLKSERIVGLPRRALSGEEADICADVERAAHLTGLVIPGFPAERHHAGRAGKATTSEAIER